MPSVPSVVMTACNVGSMAATAVPGVTVGPRGAMVAPLVVVVAEEEVPEPSSSSSEVSWLLADATQAAESQAWSRADLFRLAERAPKGKQCERGH
jgi:hypothetical protein